jgi:hypothetical protein
MQSRIRWLFFFIAMLSIVSMAARVPLDSDMWWHIKAGETSLYDSKPLLTDTFSYTRAGSEWINHSWLSQIILFLLFDKLKFYGLTLYVVTLSVIPFALLFFLMDTHPFFKALFVIIGGAIVSPIWSPRPQLFTLLLLSLLIFLVSRFRKGQLKHLWGVPILFAVWGNLHGGYFTGILYLLFLFIGIIYERIIGDQPEPDIRRRDRHLLLVSAISIPALLINPNGLNILKIPFSTVGVNILRDFIDEWASPDFHQPLQLIFLLFFLAFVFLLATQKTRLSAEKILPVIGFAVLAFYAKRNIAPLIIVLLPEFACAFNTWFKSIGLPAQFSSLVEPAQYSLRMRDELPLIMRFTNYILVFLFGLVAAGKIVYVSYPTVVNSYLEQQTPLNAYQEAAKLPNNGNMLNEYGWGGYQVMAYPELPVFVDGRTDLFGDEVIGEWMQLMRAEGDYQDLLDQYDINTVLVKKDRALVRALQDAGWKTEYTDQMAAVLSRDGN